MADIKPFCAIRYSQENITNFICPSYDTISPSEKERLQKLSQFNIVNIEFPDQVSKNNKYKNTSELLHLWQDEGVLVHDDIPAFYFYEQVFNDHGIKMTRRGFFAALKLENFYSQEGSIKFYEKIFSKSKADRLSLLKATKINISPVFGLFDDECRIVVDICKKIAKRNISAVAKDKDGVFHKLWAVDDNNIVKTLEKYLLNKKIFITDGCHRYETAWNYSQERKEKDKH
ncbi:MAG: DUF1015 domain-containing protein, partial [Endomicrobium sp.]|nr:DUF1015 domain-containing protein [Endomicrobium sp.]